MPGVERLEAYVYIHITVLKLLKKKMCSNSNVKVNTGTIDGLVENEYVSLELKYNTCTIIIKSHQHIITGKTGLIVGYFDICHCTTGI